MQNCARNMGAIQIEAIGWKIKMCYLILHNYKYLTIEIENWELDCMNNFVCQISHGLNHAMQGMG